MLSPNESPWKHFGGKTYALDLRGLLLTVQARKDKVSLILSSWQDLNVVLCVLRLTSQRTILWQCWGHKSVWGRPKPNTADYGTVNLNWLAAFPWSAGVCRNLAALRYWDTPNKHQRIFFMKMGFISWWKRRMMHKYGQNREKRTKLHRAETLISVIIIVSG